MAAQRLSDYDSAVRLLRGAFLLDHSVSVVHLGSLFRRDGDAPLQQLKRNIASAYGVAWSFPASCGTSALNVLALLSVAPPGSTVLVNRDCHVSVHAALIHGGYVPQYYWPECDPEFGIPLGPTAAAVERALEIVPDVACIIMTYPNYYGIAGEAAAIVAAARHRGIPVIADAAHGAPLHFCDQLPLAAEDAGADIVLQSTHKTMGALSQGSIAHFRTMEHVDAFYEAANYLGFVSTSFSYPVLSSIELAVAHHQHSGDEVWRRTIHEADRFREAVAQIDGLRTFGIDSAGGPGFLSLDCSRVTVDVTRTGLTGRQVEARLAEASVYPEMATGDHLLFLFTPGTRAEDTSYLAAALRTATDGGGVPRQRPLEASRPPTGEMALSPRDAFSARKRSVPVADAVGEVSGETIAPYPPGTAAVVAGEILTAEAIDYLRAVHADGAVLHGASDPSFRTMRIIPPGGLAGDRPGRRR